MVERLPAPMQARGPSPRTKQCGEWCSDYSALRSKGPGRLEHCIVGDGEAPVELLTHELPGNPKVPFGQFERLPHLGRRDRFSVDAAGAEEVVNRH